MLDSSSAGSTTRGCPLPEDRLAVHLPFLETEGVKSLRRRTRRADQAKRGPVSTELLWSVRTQGLFSHIGGLIAPELEAFLFIKENVVVSNGSIGDKTQSEVRPTVGSGQCSKMLS